MQLAHPKEAQPKPGAIGPQVCLCWTVLAWVIANSKLMTLALYPEQGIFLSASHQTGLDKKSNDKSVWL